MSCAGFLLGGATTAHSQEWLCHLRARTAEISYMGNALTTMRILSFLAACCLFLVASSCGGGAVTQPPILPPTSNFTLSWSDEFSTADGSAPDATKWTYDIGGGGWGNQELESYTSRATNVQIMGGNLAITAQAETYTGTDNIARNYTSARLKTQTLFAQA